MMLVLNPVRWLATLAAILAFTNATQNAVANGDTRTIYLTHAHTKESIAATFRVDGRYNADALRQLNWFLRDWRRDEPTNMDPRLFDVVWEVYRSAGAGNSEITVMSAYRSPETNAMLRSRSRAVAKHSQHMEGRAMDTSMPGMSMSQIREIGMRLQRGGVGYYPTSGTPFVHLDVGSVRSWPRMSYDQLVRLFPDGKTVHLPSNGQPLARYEEARAELEARGGVYVPPSQSAKGFFAFLFGGGEDDDDRGVRYERPSTRGRAIAQAAMQRPAQTQVAAYAPTSTNYDDGSRSFFSTSPSREQGVQSAAAERSPSRKLAALTPPAGQTAVSEAPAQNPATPVVNDPKPDKPQPVDSDENVTATLAPLPPRRPLDLMSYVAQAPLPPIRPNFGGAPASPPRSPSSPYARLAASPANSPIQLAGLRSAIKPSTSAPSPSGVIGMRNAIRTQASLAAPSQSDDDDGPMTTRPRNAGLPPRARAN